LPSAVTSRFAASGSELCESPVQAPGAHLTTELLRGRFLRRAVDLGVQLIDTADAYGPGVSEELIAEALFPYDGLLIATKCGCERTGPSGQSATGQLTGWLPSGRPGHLRFACEASLRRLRLDRIDLCRLHIPDLDSRCVKRAILATTTG
jgi:aryl-alcohol dehydrogenase-like predicted oxidoreductase